MARKPVDPVATELESIKKLLVLQLITTGVQAQVIGKVLGLGKSDMSRLVPARTVKKRKK